MNKLEELKSRENEIKNQLRELQEEQKRVSLEMQKSTSVDFVEALYKFRDNFTSGKVLEDFADANDALEVLAGTSPGSGYLGYLESSGIFKDDEQKGRQMRFMTSYVLSGVWRPGEDFWRVMARIAETIGNPDNPFREKEGA